MVLLFFHCTAPPDASIIPRRLQKRKDTIILYMDSNKAPTLPVEALLLPLRMPLFCFFDIIALVGCGIMNTLFDEEEHTLVKRFKISL